MEFFNPNSNVNFMGVRRWSVATSLLLIALSIGSLATRGLNLALDFTGGSLVEVNFTQSTEQRDISQALEKAGFKGALVQRFSSTNFSIRLPPSEGGESAKEQASGNESSLDAHNSQITARVKKALEDSGHPASIKPSVYVGPQVGAELAYNGIVAVVVVLLGIVLYVAWRFEWKFAVATVVTELHDVILTLGFFSLTGLEFDLTVLAAILAVDGYSVNDTIVVFDRVRELFKTTRNLAPVEVLNRAVNTTLSRTIMTSLTTLLTVLALFFFGGPTLHGFSLALIVGIIVGTLSSIFFASPVLLWLGATKQDLMPKAKDLSALERRP